MNTTKTIEEAQEQGYVIGPFQPFNNAYLDHCEQTDMPYVYIDPEGENASIGLSLAVNTWRMSLSAFREIRDLLQSYYRGESFPELLEGTIDAEFAATHALAAALERRLARKARVSLAVGDIPLAYAEAIAEEILVILARADAHESTAGIW